MVTVSFRRPVRPSCIPKILKLVLSVLIFSFEKLRAVSTFLTDMRDT